MQRLRVSENLALVRTSLLREVGKKINSNNNTAAIYYCYYINIRSRKHVCICLANYTVHSRVSKIQTVITWLADIQLKRRFERVMLIFGIFITFSYRFRFDECFPAVTNQSWKRRNVAIVT